MTDIERRVLEAIERRRGYPMTNGGRTAMRYQWEQCPNHDVNVLHVDVLLSRSFDYAEFSIGQDSLDEEDRQYLSDLTDIPGVVSVSTDKYRCQVGKAPLFDWDDIRPAMLDIFRRRYSPRSPLVEAGPVRTWEGTPDGGWRKVPV